MKKYRVLSGTGKHRFIVEGTNLTKTDANKISNRVKGIYCGESENSNHKKVRRIIKGKHCERVHTNIMEIK